MESGERRRLRKQIDSIYRIGYIALPEGYTDMVDQATICFTLGIPVHLVPGNRGNIKITTPEDIVTLEALLKWSMGNG